MTEDRSGTAGTHYDKTLYGHDNAGRRWRVKEASGTIHRTVLDTSGRATQAWIGTNDSSFTGGEPSGTDTMVKTSSQEYDGGLSGGNGHVTTSTALVEGSTTGQRITTHAYDYRGRMLLTTSPQAPHAFAKYDNLGRTLATALYSSTASISVGSDDPTSETTNRLALTETLYDERGQAWKSVRHKITQSSGADADSLTTQHWFDADGRSVKTVGGPVSKTTYDRLGRATDAYTLTKDSDGSYSDSIAIRTHTSTGDYVAEEHHTVYNATGDSILTYAVSRHSWDLDTGETRGVLDVDGDSNRGVVRATDLKGRVSMQSTWYDSLHRPTDTVASGTNSASDYDRPSFGSAHARGDTKLVTTTTYNIDGTVQQVQDPMAKVSYLEYDALGRKTKEVHNYDVSVNSGNPSGSADNQTIAYTYSNGLLTTMTAKMPSSGDDQVTTYTYGTVKGASAGDSKIAPGISSKR